MFATPGKLWKKWRASRHAGQQLDELLAHADPAAPLVTRNQWLIELMHWLQRKDRADAPRGGERADHPHVRLRYLLQMLERHPEWGRNAARTVRATLAETDALSLLCDTGLPARSAFVGALIERVQGALIAPAPTSRDLGALFTLMFGPHANGQWIATLPDDLLERLAAVLREPSGEAATCSFHTDLLAAMTVLAAQIGSTGMSREIRVRLDLPAVEELPFYRLASATQALAGQRDARADGDAPDPALLQSVNYLRALLDDCRRCAREVYAHLDRNGVSLEIVFQVESLLVRIARLEQLLDTWLAAGRPAATARLIAELVTANRASHSVRHLMHNTFALLARKLVESCAETGKHYIARTRDAYFQMLKMAAGGGAVTAVTVYIKFFITGLGLPLIVEGFLAGLNYAASFAVMHFMHFTLATKQPAMTAPTIAHDLDTATTPPGIEHFAGSVIALVRTQAAAIFGNVMLVFPLCLAAQLASARFLGADLISPAKAEHTLASFSLLGPTPLYAALTGVLLWSSSLVSGWTENWFVLHRLADVIQYNRRLRFVFGAAGAARVADFWARNFSGLAGNIALGMMLGLVPAILTAFALPFEVRHVTLSAGSIATALGVLGTGSIHTPAFWWAAAGLLSMAVLNVAVSFALAFRMALRSRAVARTNRRMLQRAILRRIVRNPLALLFPGPGGDKSRATESGVAGGND